MNKARRLVQTVGLCVKMGVEPYTLFTGDNLPVMRGMDDESVDLIYLDPPFNKKKDFIAPIGSKAEGAEFKDWWTMDDVKAEEIGEIGEKYPAVSDLINTAGEISGKSHRSYLVVMAIRLIEMKRLLKPTGSIYLHCDPTMSHWLKLVMDVIFGHLNFLNEVLWCYSTSGRSPRGKRRKWAQKHDVLLFYSKNKNKVKNDCTLPCSQAYIDSHYKQLDDEGNRCRKRIDQGKERIYYPSEGMNGNDWWSDIPYENSQSKSRTGYPTQKPLPLLERLVKASSSKGGVVLDPFCGCATTLVASQMLERKWIGIDQSVKAVDLVKIRMAQRNLFVDFHHWDTNKRGFPQKRDGIVVSPNIKTILYGEQAGVCAICDYHFRYQNLTVDHIMPKIKGGGEEDKNKQLLCGHCNSVKGGKRTNAETKARLKEIESEYKSGARA